MGTALLAALRSIFIKLLAAIAAKPLLEWLLFWIAEAIVKSTKTSHDDEFLKRLRDSYDSQENI